VSKIKTGLSKLNAVQLVSKAEEIVEAMTDNPNFATPSPALADIIVKGLQLKSAINKSRWRDQRFITARNELTVELKSMLMLLSDYVSNTSEGSAEKILSSGFEIAKQAEPLPPLVQPSGLMTVLTKHEGRILLDWISVTGALNYLVDMTTVDPAAAEPDWKVAGYTSKSRFQVDNLPSGVKYWFRVRALGTRDQSAYSEPALGMAV
jgi:hypothetical protein